MDSRRIKAHELADRARITFANGCYTVPSQSGSGSYTVILDNDDAVCDCPDFELRDKPCKHVMGVRLFARRLERGVEQDTANLEPAPKVKRLTYKQDWPNYNAAQVNEQGHFQNLLADLCKGVGEPSRVGRGRPPVPLADQVYAATMKVYSLFSARRFMGHIEEAVDRGHVSQVMHFNSVLNALENPALTSILHQLIRQSSFPLRTVETTFAPDSSGFCTSRFIRWFDVKYGVTREKAEWVKCHLMTGVKTNIVTAVEILDKDAADSPQMPKLVEATAKMFTIKEVDADKAYTSVENFETVAKHGGTLYAPFKSNMTGAAGGLFEKMFLRFVYCREDFLKHYHKRSNVESTFSAVKRKFGDSVRSKGDVAMKNEVLCKILCHNLCCCISAWYELGIEPEFATGCTNNQEPAQILKMPGA
jgi:Transposase DDE domain/SWIM zinc finger